MLAMVFKAPLGISLPALSFTSIATVRRFDMLAPTEIKTAHTKKP
ncbi:hypothetical protein [Pseudomonas sp. S2_C03]